MKVLVKTPARLHLGLIDMNGDLGRMFGGLGVAIDHPNVIIEAKRSEKFTVTGIFESGMTEYDDSYAYTSLSGESVYCWGR